MKNVIKTIVFIILLLISIHTFGYFLRPSFTLDNSWPAFIKEKKNTIDVLFIGDSGIYSDVSPMAIYRDTGITSYDLASPAATNNATASVGLHSVNVASVHRNHVKQLLPKAGNLAPILR